MSDLTGDSDYMLETFLPRLIEECKKGGKKGIYVINERELKKHRDLFEMKKEELAEAIETGALDVYIFMSGDLDALGNYDTPGPLRNAKKVGSRDLNRIIH